MQQPVSIPQASKLSTSIDKSARKMEKPQLIVSSPYTGVEHHLDLKSVPETSRQLALALQGLRPIVEDYHSKAYVDSFNWQEIINFLPSSFSGNFPPLFPYHCSKRSLTIGVFYCIAFYSTLHPNVDTSKLHCLDSLAHAEANQSGGLLKYWWQDPRDETTRKNLATCLWTSWDYAKRAGRLPMHAKAMGATRESYEMWNVERYYLKVSEGNQWELERINT